VVEQSAPIQEAPRYKSVPYTKIGRMQHATGRCPRRVAGHDPSRRDPRSGVGGLDGQTGET